jgi:hypothetical protein
VEETGGSTDLAQVTDTLYHVMLYRVRLVWAGIEFTTTIIIIKNTIILIIQYNICNLWFFKNRIMCLCKQVLINLSKWTIHCFACLMVLYASFSHISAISWRSVLLVEENGVPGENHRPVASHWQTLSHNVVHLVLIEIRINNISGDRHWLHR